MPPSLQNTVHVLHLQQLIPPTEQLQNLQEKVDDIQVQIDGGPDVLVKIILLDQHPCVEDDIAAEEQRPQKREDGTAIKKS